MIDEEEEIIQFQKDFIDVVNEIREENIFTFPVLTASLLYQNERFVDEEFARWACEASRKWNLFNFFTDSTVNSLSNCCRLKSDVTDLYFNSIGGSALKVGSVKVSTLNIARLAYQSNSEQDFLVRLRNLTELNLKILDAQRDIIKRNVDKNLLPSFSSGLVDFEHLYSTVGINGIYEAIKTFGYIKTDEFGNTYYTDEAYSLGRRIFNVIKTCIDNFSLDKDYKFNIEQERVDELVYNVLKWFIDNGLIIETIRSGGQTGVDEAGLKAGEKLGLETICLFPHGWRLRNKEGKDIKDENFFKGRFKNT